ncbi:hypothetical protein B0H11DRAFT_2108894 [Mycena galericulata]|nr:hypothetical protein B0H11DRAFT_2108894 [Mycena galericulata]
MMLHSLFLAIMVFTVGTSAREVCYGENRACYNGFFGTQCCGDLNCVTQPAGILPQCKPCRFAGASCDPETNDLCCDDVDCIESSLGFICEF